MPQRLFFLDWLRIAAFTVLVVFHVGMYYVSWPFHVKSPFAGPQMVPWMLLTAPWRMDLIFMVSGAATALMLDAGASVALLKQRSKFILLPLLCGMVLIVPPQTYLEVIEKFNYPGNYFSFLKLYLTRYQGFCGSGPCLIMPTWNHLWFLPYLFIYTTILWALVRFSPQALRRLADVTLKVLRGPWLLILPIALIVVIRMALVERFPATHAVVRDWFNHAMYFSMFLIGAVFAKSPGMWQRLEQIRWLALVSALLSWLLLIGVRPSRPIEHLVIACMLWGACVAAFGFSYRRLNRDHPWRHALTEAVFPVYILHQTIIIIFSQVLRPLAWQPAIEGPVLIFLAFFLSFLGYLAVRGIGPLRPWFGLRAISRV